VNARRRGFTTPRDDLTDCRSGYTLTGQRWGPLSDSQSLSSNLRLQCRLRLKLSKISILFCHLCESTLFNKLSLGPQKWHHHFHIDRNTLTSTPRPILHLYYTTQVR
jgi:hypothetical protein